MEEKQMRISFKNRRPIVSLLSQKKKKQTLC